MQNMNKMTQHEKIVQQKIANKRFKRKTRKRKKSKKVINSGYSEKLKVGRIQNSDNKKVIDFPENIDLYNEDNAKKLLDIISDAEKNISTTNIYQLNFNHTKKITLSGGISLKAFYDKLIFNGIEVRVKINEHNNKTRQILKHIGLRKNDPIKIIHDDIICWEVRKWEFKDREDSSAIQEIEPIVKKLCGEKTILQQNIITVLSEAIWNCFEHAYLDIPRDDFQNTYLFSGKHENDIVFCVLDRGIGFRGSFKIYHPTILDVFKSELQYIEAALEYGKSKADGFERGSGLPELINDVKDKLNGYVSIYSKKAYYFQDTTNTGGRDRQSDIQGSLVQIIFSKDILDTTDENPDNR